MCIVYVIMIALAIFIAITYAAGKINEAVYEDDNENE